MTDAPTPAARYLQDAANLIDLGRYDQALEAAKQAISIDPNQADGYIYCAWISHATGEYALAEQAAERALALNPQDSRAHHVRAVLHWHQGRHLAARAAFEEALALSTLDRNGVLNNYARFLASFDQRDTDAQALELVEQSLQAEPNNAATHELRAALLARIGENPEPAQRAALRLDPHSVPALLAEAERALAANDADTALDRLRGILQREPHHQAARGMFVTALKARNPLYGNVLAFLLYVRNWQIDRRVIIGVVGGFFGLFLLSALLSDAVPFFSWLGRNMVWAFLIVFLGGMGINVLLRSIADPLFNLALLRDPTGRNVVQFPVDYVLRVLTGLVVGGGLIAWIIARITLGDSATVSNVIFAIVFPSILLPLLALPTLGLEGWPKRAAWGGAIITLLALYTATVSSALRAETVSALGMVVFGGGLAVLLLTRLVTARNIAPAWRGSIVVIVLGLLTTAVGIIIINVPYDMLPFQAPLRRVGGNLAFGSLAAVMLPFVLFFKPPGIYRWAEWLAGVLVIGGIATWAVADGLDYDAIAEVGLNAFRLGAIATFIFVFTLAFLHDRRKQQAARRPQR